ncbi:MAG: hypothetical protein M1834_003434 [Cirrosporium novae-zelandiae]|nr:MAG: hypothetical protein M1834_003434 [Cirrosporium novae-zelandiae]
MSDAAIDEFNRYISPRTNTSSHPEDRYTDDADQESNASSHHQTFDSSDEDNLSLPQDSTMPSATYTLPSSTSVFHANTGPKGVIADAHSYDRARKRSFRQTLRDFTSFTNNNHKSEAVSTANANHPTSPDSDDSDSEFMRTWRAARMRELQDLEQKKQMAMNQRRMSPSQRTYGSLDTVDAAGYLDAVEKVHKDTIVVVMIYDDESEGSAKLTRTLTNLAMSHPTTHFIRLHHEEAELDPAVVPGVLAYRGGDIFANLVPFVESLKHQKHTRLDDIDAVDECLQRHNILPQLS